MSSLDSGVREIINLLEVYLPKTKKLIKHLRKGCSPNLLDDKIKNEITKYISDENILKRFFSDGKEKYEDQKERTKLKLSSEYIFQTSKETIDAILKDVRRKKISIDKGKRYLDAFIDLNPNDADLIRFAKRRLIIALDMENIFKKGILFGPNNPNLTYDIFMEDYTTWLDAVKDLDSNTDNRKKLIASLYFREPTPTLSYFPLKYNPTQKTVTVSEYGKDDKLHSLNNHEIQLIERINSSRILPDRTKLLYETLFEITNIPGITPTLIYMTYLRDKGKLEIPNPSEKTLSRVQKIKETKLKAEKEKEERLNTTIEKPKSNRLTKYQINSIDANIEAIRNFKSSGFTTIKELFQTLRYNDKTLYEILNGDSKTNAQLKVIAMNRLRMKK